MASRLHNLFLIIAISTIVGYSIIFTVRCDHASGKSHDDKQEGDDDHTHHHLNHAQVSDPEYIRRELKELIMLRVDVDKDGYVSFEELKNYLRDLHEKNIEFNVHKQWTVYSPQIHEVFSWEGYEPERKEVLTWDHYFNQTYPELVGVDIGLPVLRQQDAEQVLDPEKVEEAKKKVDEIKQKTSESDEDENLKALKLMVFRADARWKLADENGDTLLTKTEFKSLLHPDEGNEELQALFVREATEDMDLNKDGKICLDEFMKHLQVLASEQERENKNWLASQQENFGRFLDKNKDGILDAAEVKDWLVPQKSVKFQSEAKRYLDIGDANQDHKLSMAEIMENYQQFLPFLPAEYWHSDDLEDEEHEPESMLMGDHGTREEL